MINKKTKLTLIIGIALMSLMIFAAEAGSQQSSRIPFVGDGKLSNLRRQTRSLNAGQDSLGKSVEVARSVNTIPPPGPGSLDPTFGMNGKVTASTSDYSDGARSVAIQADGKIVTAGYSYVNDVDFGLVRFNTDGSLDASFDTDGKVTTDFGGTYDKAEAVAIQADGKIVVAGVSNQGFALVRYNVDGSLDSSFDGDGKVRTGELYYATAIAIQADGKIIAAGSAPYNFALARYNTDGSLDTSFDGDGIVTTDFSIGTDVAHAVTIQSDGKIIAAGSGNVHCNPFPNERCFSDIALARYNTDGSLDTTFGTDGKVITVYGGDDRAHDIAIQADGKIITAGGVSLVRYNSDGSLDGSFDFDGRVQTPSCCTANAVAIQSDEKIVGAGYKVDVLVVDKDPVYFYDFAVFRYNPNGSPDTSFCSDGKVTTSFGVANDVAIQADGKIVAAGAARAGTTADDFAVARYIGDAAQRRSTLFDYDGDGRSDISVFRPAGNGTWWVLQSSNNAAYQASLNVPADKIVPADYDGDGRTDIAQYNSTTGTWYIPRPCAPNHVVRFGTNGDIPMPSDYDGDGKADIAVYRPSTGTWWILQSGNGLVLIQRFGLADDKPVASDYDGDGHSDIAVYRPSEGIWYLLQSTAGFGAARFGLAEDKPTVGDYDGDGKSDLAVFRPSTNVWYVLRSTNGSFFAVQFGLANDILAAADYDGDNKTDIAVFRPSSGVWYILQSSNSNVSYHQFGLNGDLPTPSAFIPQ